LVNPINIQSNQTQEALTPSLAMFEVFST